MSRKKIWEIGLQTYCEDSDITQLSWALSERPLYQLIADISSP